MPSWQKPWLLVKEHIIGRSNHPDTIENWNSVSSWLPYRASIGGNCYWDVDWPSPRLIDANKVCPGGRILLAFEIAEVRDFFVEGHAHQGAHAEADFCERATPRKPTRARPPLPTDYEAALVEFKTALQQNRAVSLAMEVAFIDEIKGYLSEKKVAEAVSLAKSMPPSGEKSIAYTLIQNSGLGGFDLARSRKADFMPYDAERASVMLQWQMAKHAAERIDDVFYELAYDKAQIILADDGHEALAEFVKGVPNSIAKANLMMLVDKSAPKSAPAATGPRF